ncbi:hypothetical protein K8I28_10500, partial [bacterium]|nr:hypothetical protein [bacterium]
MILQRKKIAVVQLARFGDLIQTSPLLQNLKKQDSAVKTNLVVDKRSRHAAELLGDVDEILTVDLQEAAYLCRRGHDKSWKLLSEWSKPLRKIEPFDELILLNQGSIPSAIATFIPARSKKGPFFGKPLPPPHAYLNIALEFRGMNTIHLSEIWAAYGPAIYPLSEPKLKENFRGTSFAFLESRNAANPDNQRIFAVNLGAGAANRRLQSEIVADLVK